MRKTEERLKQALIKDGWVEVEVGEQAAGIVKRLLSKKCKGIYGYMHGSPWIHTGGEGGNRIERDEIIFIEKGKLRIEPNCLLIMRGWPGTDWGYYDYKDIGKTWAFTKADIKDPGSPPLW